MCPHFISAKKSDRVAYYGKCGMWSIFPKYSGCTNGYCLLLDKIGISTIYDLMIIYYTVELEYNV